ncbi:MAG TPA: TolC family protein [Terracidiphilus sp.]|nr:TolC family protein [Terracidiphilus sp.]
MKPEQNPAPCPAQWARRPLLALAVAALAVGPAALHAQTQFPNPSSAQSPFYGSVTVQMAGGDALHLSLDQAVQMGLKNNLGLKEAENSEKLLKGEKNEARQEFLPNIALNGGTGVYQHNLAAQGFNSSVVAGFGSHFPGGQLPMGVSFITKDDLTQGMLTFKQTLFSGPVIAGWKAAGAAERVAYYAKESARGEVVQQVASAYLHAVAAASEVDNATAQLAADKVALQHAHDAHMAGTASNLDELRARVQFQAQQQALIAVQNAHEKDLILLKREIGIDPGRDIVLTDATPYSDLTEQTPAEVRALAYRYRQDYQNLQNQVVELRAAHSAYRAQRLPTLKFSGYWGVDTVNGAGTHGNFAAVGTLSIPVFREARLRGNEDASKAQLESAEAQLDDLRNHIDEQVRDALLDVSANQKLVAVARSNVDLATQALSDETDRVNAGVDDNLPLVTAQARLAAAENNMVESLYRCNLSKLALARAAGVLETHYRDYIGR